MGGLPGHVVPGVLFMYVGIWSTIQVWRKYYKSKLKKNHKFQSDTMYSYTLWAIDIQALMLVVGTTVGIISELFFSGIHPGAVILPRNIQHCVMYSFFMLFGLLELFKTYLKKWLPIVDEISYISFALANLVEGILFSFHLMGRDMIDTSLHTLLVYTCYACALITVLELIFRYNILVSLGRGFCTLLQGTWFIQTGFILYSPFKGGTLWDPKDHTYVMLVACLFALHLGGVFLFIIVSGCVINCIVSYCSGRSKINHKDEELAVTLLNDEDDSQTLA